MIRTEAVLFDLDGTLIDTPQAIASVLGRMVRERGGAVDPAGYRGLVGKPLDVVLTAALGPADPAELDSAKAEFRQAFSEAVVPRARSLLFPGIDTLLRQLADNGQRLAVVTSKITASAHELLSAARLGGYFGTVVGHDQAERGKPAPDLALMAAAHLSVDPSRCVVVGDAVDDIAMADAAGMAAVGVSWGVASAEQLAGAGAAWVATDVAELRRNLCPPLASLPSAAGHPL